MCESENTPYFIYADTRPPRDLVPNSLRDYSNIERYKKIGYFGKGGYSTCYEFINTRTKIKYAIKAVPKRRGGNYELTNRKKAFAEADIHGSIQHENIVRLFNVFEDNDNVYLVLEPCRYGTLANVLTNRGRVSPIEARYYLRQIAQGCAYLHERLIIHRDLKVNNILIDETMTVKIADFGFALQLDDRYGQSTAYCGTPNYLSPEVVTKSGHSFEADSWSIGCIAYTLLVGTLPFYSTSKEETYSLIRLANYHPIPQHINVPTSAINLINQTLELDPTQRLSVFNILCHDFLVEPPEIPHRLPVSLLAPLNRNGENVTMENYVMSLIEHYQCSESCCVSKSVRRVKKFNGFLYRFIRRCFCCC